jgi:AcrR family transcriptional regulator
VTEAPHVYSLGAAPTPEWIVGSSPALTRRGERTRQKIVAAARSLAEAQPYDSVAVSDIARLSGTSVGSFYRYFTNKESLLVSLLSEAFWEMYSATRGSWDTDLPYLENLIATTRSYLLAYRRNGRLLKSAMKAAETSDDVRNMWWSMRRDLYSHMAGRLQEAQAQSPLPALDRRITIRALGGMIESYARRTFADEEFGPTTEADVISAAEVLARLWCRTVFGDDNGK